MKRSSVLRRVAEQEFDDSIAYYEGQRTGLGLEFRAIIPQQFQHISDNPEQFQKVRGEVHRAVIIRRFPFMIHFLIEPERIVILSVCHTSRDLEQLKSSFHFWGGGDWPASRTTLAPLLCNWFYSWP